jgi:outer membrane lipoprotein-sorting protein
MIRKASFLAFGLFPLLFLLTGCPKKVPEPFIQEKKFAVNPIEEILETLSFAETLEAKASIRIDTVSKGERVTLPVNGDLIYQKPVYLRLQGYHPFGMGLFDALYRDGEFFLLIPSQKRAYTSEISQMESLMERAGPIQILVEKNGGNGIPRRIQIEIIEKDTRIDLKLKDIVVNSVLPEDSFEWIVPEGVEVRPLTGLLRGEQ